jgi:hypothetical protein
MTTYRKGDLTTIADTQRVVFRAYCQRDDAAGRLRRERGRIPGLGVTRRFPWSIVHHPYPPTRWKRPSGRGTAGPCRALRSLRRQPKRVPQLPTSP